MRRWQVHLLLSLQCNASNTHRRNYFNYSPTRVPNWKYLPEVKNSEVSVMSYLISTGPWATPIRKGKELSAVRKVSFAISNLSVNVQSKTKATIRGLKIPMRWQIWVGPFALNVSKLIGTHENWDWSSVWVTKLPATAFRNFTQEVPVSSPKNCPSANCMNTIQLFWYN